MRKTVLILLLLVVVFSVVSAQAQVDISALSYNDLLSLQDDVSRALRASEPVNGNLVYDKDGVRIFFTGHGR